jgi:putative transcriptional regulator
LASCARAAALALSFASGCALAQNALLLVAKPDMLDPNFRETVVLVTQAPDSSTVGVILNRPTTVRHEPGGELIYSGGPVMPRTVVALFRSESVPAAPSFHVLKGIYLSMHPAIVERLTPPYPHSYRLYSGFAGWRSGQLESELALEVWHVLPASEALLFRNDTSNMWRELVDRAGAQRTHSQNVTDVAVR